MSNSTIPNGTDIFIAENQRVEEENKIAAQELAAQLVKAYIERFDIATRVEFTIWIDQTTLPLTGVAKNIYHRNQVRRETISILNSNGWDCCATTIYDCGQVRVGFLLLPAGVDHPRVRIGGGGGRF